MKQLSNFSLILPLLFLLSCQSENNSVQPQKDPEQHRPQFHYSPETSWMNDPNGMVYYEGEYHLFFQYYPYASVWGPMHWGHAVSEDLVHWEHLPIALYPDEHGHIFSGSAVIDWNNTSGFGNGETPPMIALFTYHDMVGEKTYRTDYQTQGLAYSLDKGRTWIKYSANPIIENQGIKDFRDPKVFWYEADQKWVMVLAVKDRIQIYSSPNLKEWTMESELGEGTAPQLGVWECPDLFQLPVEGTDQQKWVMIISHGGGGPSGGSCTRYLIGDFDGSTFTSDYPLDQLNWLDYGKDNYAGVTWSDVPEEDGRRLFIGWMSNWQYAKEVPTEKWRSAMTIARNLKLKETPIGIRLFSEPVAELNSLRGEAMETAKSIEGKQVIAGLDAGQAELELTFDLAQSDAESFGLELSNDRGEYVRISFENTTGLIIVDRSHTGEMDVIQDFALELQYIPLPKAYGEKLAYSLSEDKMKWQFYLDRSSFELFVDDGGTVITDIFFPTENFNQVHLFANGGKVALESGKAFNLKGIW